MNLTENILFNFLIIANFKGIGFKNLKKIINSLESIDRLENIHTEYKNYYDLFKLKISYENFKESYEISKNAILWSKKNNNHIIPFYCEDYPKKLLEIYNPPIYLYAKGNISLLNSLQIAVVGTRKYSSYGESVTKLFIKDLVNYNFTITSGLALGIDSISHYEALKNQGKTIAVLGTGLNIIYPSKNKNLAEDILKKDGLIISEFNLNTKPTRYNFPKRNRIISGLSLGTLVIESPLKSGSLITAKYALEQNREVFAIPNNIYDENSLGCNSLIKSGAKLVLNVNDILEEYEYLNFSYSNKESNIFIKKDVEENKPFEENKSVEENNNLSKNHIKVLETISFDVTNFDVIINKLDLDIDDISLILLDLEINNLICQIEGGYIKNK